MTTKTQLLALEMIAHLGDISQDRHARRGFHFTEGTVQCLSRRGWIAPQDVNSGDGTTTRAAWVLTDAGRAALAGAK